MYIYVLYRHYYRHKHTYTALWRYWRSAVASTKRLHRPKSVGRSHEAPLVEYFKRPPSLSVHSSLPLVVLWSVRLWCARVEPTAAVHYMFHNNTYITQYTLWYSSSFAAVVQILPSSNGVLCIFRTIVPACYGGVVFLWKTLKHRIL